MSPNTQIPTTTEEVGVLRDFFFLYRARTLVMLACLLLAGFAEGIGLATLLPMLELLSQHGVAADNESLITVAMRELLGGLGLAPSIGAMLVLLVVSTALKGGLLLLAMLQTGYTVAQVTTDLRIRVIRAVLETEWRYFIEHPIGTVANAIATESQRASQAYYAVCLMVAEVIQVGIYAALAFAVSPTVTLLALGATPILFLLFRPMVRRAKRAGQEQTVLQKRILAWVTNSLQGIKPIKAMGREDFVGPILDQDVQILNGALRRQVLAVQILKTQQEPVFVAVLALVLYGLITLGDTPFASLVMLALLFYRIIGQASGLQKHYQTLVINQSAYWSLNELAASAEKRREQGHGIRMAVLERDIEFDHVSLCLNDHVILDDVQLRLPNKGFVALSGPSGAGKTSLVDALCGLVPTTGGEIRVDGVPLADLNLASWRRLIGYVPQEMTLFHETVRNNLTLGESRHSDADIAEALRQAGLDEFIATLPEGLETVMGERGARFSGGQRQRLAIARALVRKPHLLIMDEVTTSLDPATEQAICLSLREIARNALVLVISHQPAVVAAAERVIHLERGKIMENSCDHGETSR